MPYNVKDYFVETSAGNTGANAEIIHKFGHNAAVGTSYVPISEGGIYRTPQVGSATTLRVKAGNAADTVDGVGARQVCLQGLDETGTTVTEYLDTAGESASSNTTATFIRLFRAFVSESGTYATQSTSSHVADIVIENSAGTEDWASLKLNNFAESQSVIAAYTVPLGKTAYVSSVFVSVETNKSASLIFFQRQGILKTAAPYDAMRIVLELHGVTNESGVSPKAPLGPFPELTDIGVMAEVVSGTAEVDVDFEIILRDKE